MGKLDKFTLNLLTNDEVISINQDALGKEARQTVKNDKYQVWVKELKDGGKAIGIFNTSEKYQSVSLDVVAETIKGHSKAIDAWTQRSITGFSGKTAFKIPPHGVKLIKVL